jgi:hypothetical protein
VDKLFPIYTLDENKNVLSPNAMRLWVESVDNVTIGDEMYREEPRPWTVEARPVELTYCEEPKPCIEETNPVTGELKKICPRPWTVETRADELM